MNEPEISRRSFALLTGAAAAAQVPLPGANALTARDVATRLQNALGGDWPTTGPDGFKAGNPETPVKGIATTAMATLDVLRRAAKAGVTLVFTYEPTFFGRQDGPAPAGRGPAGLTADDPVYKAKQDFIASNGLVVFRLREHWQMRPQSEMTTGLAESLGWAKYRVKPDDSLYEIPAATA